MSGLELSGFCLILASLGAQFISDVINFETEDGDLFILPGICPALDKLKSTYDQLPEVLTKVLSSCSWIG